MNIDEILEENAIIINRLNELIRAIQDLHPINPSNAYFAIEAQENLMKGYARLVALKNEKNK